MSEIEAIELAADEYKYWDELVEKSPHGTVFHRSSWLTTCSALLGRRLRIFGCLERDKLVGGCSLFMYPVKPLLKFASSVCAMTPYGGVVLSEVPGRVRQQQEKSRQIVGSICRLISTQGFQAVNLVNSPDFIDVRPFTWNGWQSRVLYTYYFHPSEEFVVPPKVMWRINRAIKDGLVVRRSDDIESYYELFRMTFLRQGLKPPVSKAFLTQLFRLAKSELCGDMWVAETASGEMASAEITLWDKGRAYAWSAASHTKLRTSGAPSLLVYDLVRDLREKDFRDYDQMCGNTPQLASFISAFNPQLVPYYAVQKSATGFLYGSKILSRFQFLHRSLSGSRFL